MLVLLPEEVVPPTTSVTTLSILFLPAACLAMCTEQVPNGTLHNHMAAGPKQGCGEDHPLGKREVTFLLVTTISAEFK